MKKQTHHFILLWSISAMLLQSCTAKPAKEVSVSFSRDSSGIYKEAQEHNLKGKVKSVRSMLYKGTSTTYDYYPQREYSKTIPKGNRIYYFDLPRDIHYDMESYYEYNKKGNQSLYNHASPDLDSITQAIEKKYNVYFYYDKKEIQEKERYKPRMHIPFPAYNPYLIHLSQLESDSVQWDGKINSINNNKFSQNTYIYTYDKRNRIQQEIAYLIPDSQCVFREEDVLKEVNKTYINTRTIYEYDDKDRIIAQKIIVQEADREPFFTDCFVHDMSFSVFDDFRRTFQYDEKNRLKNVSLFVNNELSFSETYTYAPQGYISELKRFIISALTHEHYLADNVIEQYDENGNLTQVQEVSGKGEVIKTRYYEYTLDEYKNWVECRMYFEGRTKEPTATVKRIIEYYKD